MVPGYTRAAATAGRDYRCGGRGRGRENRTAAGDGSGVTRAPGLAAHGGLDMVPCSRGTSAEKGRDTMKHAILSATVAAAALSSGMAGAQISIVTHNKKSRFIIFLRIKWQVRQKRKVD